MVHHKAPHRPWVPHERHRDLYPAGSIPEPLTMWDDHSGRASVVQAVRMTIADDLTDADIKETVPAELLGAENSRERAAWKYQRYMRDYLQTVQAVDDGSADFSTGSMLKAWPRTPSWSTPRTKASSSETTAGSTSA